MSEEQRKISKLHSYCGLSDKEALSALMKTGMSHGKAMQELGIDLSDSDKEMLYDDGAYSFPVPSVCHGKWNRADWIRYVDLCGFWHLHKLEEGRSRQNASGV